MKTIKGCDSEDRLKSLQFDLIALGGGWPELVPAGVIRLPRLGVVNTHPSLLPEFRGTDVHRWQVFHGVRESGTTIHYVDETFDTGNILSQVAVPIVAEDCPQELATKAAEAAGPLMEETLERVSHNDPGRVPSASQPDRSDARRYFSRWRWEDPDFMRLDWTQPAESLYRFVLACTQESYRYNGPFFQVRGRSYLLRTSSLTPHDGSGMPGEVVRMEAGGVVVRCGGDRNALRLMQIQRSSEEERRNQFHQDPAFLAEEAARAAEFSVGDNLNEVR
jgi:methionyl-tRNA formyltransferase